MLSVKYCLLLLKFLYAFIQNLFKVGGIIPKKDLEAQNASTFPFLFTTTHAKLLKFVRDFVKTKNITLWSKLNSFRLKFHFCFPPNMYTLTHTNYFVKNKNEI
jgi:hypothetical protein